MSPIVHHPLIVNLGFVELNGFGIALAAAFGIAGVVVYRLAAVRGYDTGPVVEFIFAAMAGGLLGGKLFYLATHRGSEALLDRGGLVFWGGLVGGTLGVMLVVALRRFGMMRTFDLAGPAVAAAYAVGRTGCWAVGDDYGTPWDGPLAVTFPHGLPPSTAGIMRSVFDVPIPPGVDPSTVLAVHPTQLYEVAMALGMFGILWRLRSHTHAAGWLFGVYLVLAGVERFAVEFWRAKDDRTLGALTLAQLIALGFIVVGTLWMSLRLRVGPGKPGIYGPRPLVAAAPQHGPKSARSRRRR